MIRWSVAYETASIARGEEPTYEEADRAAWIEHDRRVIEGLDPDKLAVIVDKPPVNPLEEF